MDVHAAVAQMSAGLKSEFISALGGIAPTPQEEELLVWSTQTLAAGSVLAGNVDTREAVAKAKAILLNLAAAKAIQGEQHVKDLIQSAVSKAVPIILMALTAA